MGTFHDSGYERREKEHYPTPAWVVRTLLKIIPVRGLTIWEPCCGEGQFAEALKSGGANVLATDIKDYGYQYYTGTMDFLGKWRPEQLQPFDGIMTNPPFGERGKLAEAFIHRGLECIANCGWPGFFAYLLPSDFDAAKTRKHLFENSGHYVGHLKIRGRIKWFQRKPEEMPIDPVTGERKKDSTPMHHHSIFIWGNAPVIDHKPAKIWYGSEK